MSSTSKNYCEPSTTSDSENNTLNSGQLLFMDESTEDLDNYLNAPLTDDHLSCVEEELECPTMNSLSKNIKAKFHKSSTNCKKNKFFKSKSLEEKKFVDSSEVPVINEAMKKILKESTYKPPPKHSIKALKTYSNKHKEKPIVETFALPDEPLASLDTSQKTDLSLINLDTKCIEDNFDDSFIFSSWMTSKFAECSEINLRQDFRQKCFAENASYVEENIDSDLREGFNFDEDTFVQDIKESSNINKAETNRRPVVCLKPFNLDDIELFKSNDLSSLTNSKELLIERWEKYDSKLTENKKIQKTKPPIETSKFSEPETRKPNLRRSTRSNTTYVDLQDSSNTFSTDSSDVSFQPDMCRGNGSSELPNDSLGNVKKNQKEPSTEIIVSKVQSTSIFSPRRYTRRSAPSFVNLEPSNRINKMCSSYFEKSDDNFKDSPIKEQRSSVNKLEKHNDSSENIHSPPSRNIRISLRSSNSSNKLMNNISPSKTQTSKPEITSSKKKIPSSEQVKENDGQNLNQTIDKSDTSTRKSSRLKLKFDDNSENLLEPTNTEDEKINLSFDKSKEIDVDLNNSIDGVNMPVKKGRGRPKKIIPLQNEEATKEIKEISFQFTENESLEIRTSENVLNSDSSPLKCESIGLRNSNCTSLKSRSSKADGTIPNEFKTGLKNNVCTSTSSEQPHNDKNEKEMKSLECMLKSDKNKSCPLKIPTIEITNTEIPEIIASNEKKITDIDLNNSKDKIAGLERDSNGTVQKRRGRSKKRTPENEIANPNSRTISNQLESDLKNNMDTSKTDENEKQVVLLRRRGRSSKRIENISEVLKPSENRKENEESNKMKDKFENEILYKFTNTPKDNKSKEVSNIKDGKNLENFSEECMKSISIQNSKCNNVPLEENETIEISNKKDASNSSISPSKCSASPNQSFTTGPNVEEKNKMENKEVQTHQAPIKRKRGRPPKITMSHFNTTVSEKSVSSNNDVDKHNGKIMIGERIIRDKMEENTRVGEDQNKQKNNEEALHNCDKNPNKTIESTSGESNRILQSVEDKQLCRTVEIRKKVSNECKKYVENIESPNCSIEENNIFDSNNSNVDQKVFTKKEESVDNNMKLGGESKVFEVTGDILPKTELKLNILKSSHANELIDKKESKDDKTTSDYHETLNYETKEKTKEKDDSNIKYSDFGYDINRRTSFRKILERVMEASRLDMMKSEASRTQRCKSVPHEKFHHSREVDLKVKSFSADSKTKYLRDKRNENVDHSRVKRNLDFNSHSKFSFRKRTKSMHVTDSVQNVENRQCLKEIKSTLEQIRNKNEQIKRIEPENSNNIIIKNNSVATSTDCPEKIISRPENSLKDLNNSSENTESNSQREVLNKTSEPSNIGDTDSEGYNTDQNDMEVEELLLGEVLNESYKRERSKSFTEGIKVNKVSHQSKSVIKKKYRKKNRRSGVASQCSESLLKKVYDFEVGDSIWGKIGNYPYWPGLIVEDPETSTFKKFRLLRTAPYYHIRFFGDNGKRAWTTHCIPYQGSDDLDKLRVQCDEEGVPNNDYLVKTQTEKWKKAVAEAEIVRNYSPEEKLKFFDKILPSQKTEVSKFQDILEFSPKRARSKSFSCTTNKINLTLKSNVSPKEKIPMKISSLIECIENVVKNQSADSSPQSKTEVRSPLKKRSPLKDAAKDTSENLGQTKAETKKVATPPSRRRSISVKDSSLLSYINDVVKKRSPSKDETKDTLGNMGKTDAETKNVATPPSRRRSISMKDSSVLSYIDDVVKKRSPLKDETKDTLGNMGKTNAETKNIAPPPTRRRSFSMKDSSVFSYIHEVVKKQSPLKDETKDTSENIGKTNAESKSVATPPSRKRSIPMKDSSVLSCINDVVKKFCSNDTSPEVTEKKTKPSTRRRRDSDTALELLDIPAPQISTMTTRQNNIKSIDKKSPVRSPKQLTTETPISCREETSLKRTRSRSLLKLEKRRLSSEFKQDEESQGEDSKTNTETTCSPRRMKLKRRTIAIGQINSQTKTDSMITDCVSRLPEFKKNLFRGITKEKVCQLCEKPGEVVKCRGPCNGDFHIKCIENFLKETEESTLKETELKLGELDLEKNKTPPDSKQVEISTIVSRDKFSDKVILSPINKKIPIMEQFDRKMKELMTQVESRISIESTDSSSEEIDLLADRLEAAKKNNGRNTKKPKGRFKHVTADDVCLINLSDIDPPNQKSTTSENTEQASSLEEGVYKCPFCISTTVIPPCFVCNSIVSKKGNTMRQRCSLQKCGRYYHLECLNVWHQTQWSFILHDKRKTEAFDSFVCPRHSCHICACENMGFSMGRCPNDKLVKCLRCPATYHNSYNCVPAGTDILTSTQIICPRHVEGNKKTNTLNTIWCFVCSEGGNLICCETCPTSVHVECLPVNLLDDDTYICEDCESGRFPLYDEVVWVKCGTFRWWPAIILFPSEIPQNVESKPHSKGEFVVKFFGTYNYFWVGRGRTFLYQEGDTGCLSNTKNKIDEAFVRALQEAANAYSFKKGLRAKKQKEVNNGLKPPTYVRIKVNRPVGNVKVFEGNLSNTTPCDCDPKDKNPCGPNSNCLNRILLTECNPEICPAGQKCKNQCFEKREYPQVIPYRTTGRGWGLKTLELIKKGRFVIEYVGEIIDDEEYQRRISRMHQQKDENYYFLTIDKDRMLDAGPKGNVARFMNHSCQPNCETQKWTVNGDTRVGLFAIEDIAADTELTFNYNLECVGTEKKICRCGAPNCSGFIGLKPDDQKQLRKTSSVKTVDQEKQSDTTVKDKCFICNTEGDCFKCSHKMCLKSYHLECVQLDSWPYNGRWNCPAHNCNICSKRTSRICVLCNNSYCPFHSVGKIRYDDSLGFLCSEHEQVKKNTRRKSNRVCDTTEPSTSNVSGISEKKNSSEGERSESLRSERYKKRISCSETKNPAKRMKLDQ